MFPFLNRYPGRPPRPIRRPLPRREVPEDRQFTEGDRAGGPAGESRTAPW